MQREAGSNQADGQSSEVESWQLSDGKFDECIGEPCSWIQSAELCGAEESLEGGNPLSSA